MPKQQPLAYLPHDATEDQVRKVINEVIRIVLRYVGDERVKFPELESGSRVTNGETFRDPDGLPIFHRQGEFFRFILDDQRESLSYVEVLKELQYRILLLQGFIKGTDRWREFYF